jgi:hypothetical protein
VEAAAAFAPPESAGAGTPVALRVVNAP